MNRKPRLTARALIGLGHLAGLVDAGGPEEITGYDEEQMARMAARGEPDAQEQWQTVLAACRWIRAAQNYQDATLSVPAPQEPTT